MFNNGAPYIRLLFHRIIIVEAYSRAQIIFGIQGVNLFPKQIVV